MSAHIAYGILFKDNPGDLDILDTDDLPVDIIYTSGKFMLVTKASMIKSPDDNSTQFSPMDLHNIDPVPMNKLLFDFCVKNDIDIPNEPKWYLFNV